MEKIPKLMSIREVAKTGLMSEYSLRELNREGRLPVIKLKNKVLVNYERFVEMINKGEV